MMKYQNFICKKLINIYFKKHFSNQKAFYSVVDIERYLFFFKRYTALFYTETDIETEIKNALKDLLEAEFKITIHTCRCDFSNMRQGKIKIDLITKNDNLLVGKFGQNQKSLRDFLSKAVAFKFKKKCEIILNFLNQNNIIFCYFIKL